MRLIRPIALAAGAVVLTGCSLNLSNADTSPASSTRSTAPAAGSATTTPVTDPASTPATASTPTASGQDFGESSDDKTADASSSAPAVDSGPVTRYADKVGLLQLPVSNASIPDAPAGLRDFARAQLKQMWHDQFQDDPGCEGIAQVRIKRSTPSLAYVEASWGATTPTCPQYAGNPGWWEVWGTTSGSDAWSVTLKGEGTASCNDLVSHAIPRSVYPTCSNGSQKVPNPVG